MQIVIPMSGFGERFRKAGYDIPKPLIEVQDKPIIAHVIDMFPGETDFHFICNREHLENPDYKMRDILSQHCPSGKIYSIEPHKSGPVFAVQKIKKHLRLDKPVVVNYCDFKTHGLYDSNEIKERFFYLEKYYFNKKILIFDCNKNNININIFN